MYKTVSSSLFDYWKTILYIRYLKIFCNFYCIVFRLERIKSGWISFLRHPSEDIKIIFQGDFFDNQKSIYLTVKGHYYS